MKLCFLFFRQSRKFNKWPKLVFCHKVKMVNSSSYLIHQKETFKLLYYTVFVWVFFVGFFFLLTLLCRWAKYLSWVITSTTKVTYPVFIEFYTCCFFYWHCINRKLLRTFKDFNTLCCLLVWDKPPKKLNT